MSALDPQTVYLSEGSESVCVQFHPVGTNGPDAAVVMCPPFGWEEVCTYRPRREWARRLAAAGLPVARLSLPSTGNSGGLPLDAGRVQAWTDAVATTACWIRHSTSARRVVAIGIGLGGLVAYRAAADGAEIDDLVLWATPTRGRSFVRQVRAFSRMEASQFFADLELPPPLPDGHLEAGGFLLSAETIQDLEKIDLATLKLPDAAARRVMLLGQDGIGVDERLLEALTASGVSLTTGRGEGYGEMSSHPQTAQAPETVIAEVAEWLRAPSLNRVRHDRTGDGAAASSGDLTFASDGTVRVRERAFLLSQPAGRLVGTLAEPLGGSRSRLCVVLLNAGGIYRIGPNRMWVEAARRWAGWGVSTLRLDVAAIGDSDGAPTPYADDASLYVPELVPQVLQAVDALHAQGIGERFVLGGLCSGAYWAFHGALQHERVDAAMMLNPRVLVWESGVSRADDDLRVLRTGALSWAKVKKNFSLRRALSLGIWLLGARRRGSEQDDLLSRFERSGKRALLVFSQDEPLHTDLVLSGRLDRLRRSDRVMFEELAVRDHTLRPTWSQREAHRALDRALERELARTGDHAAGKRPDSVTA